MEAETRAPLALDTPDVPLRGRLALPGDKSIAHRALLLSAAAHGTSRLSGLPDAADVRTTLRAVEALGAGVESVSSSSAAVAAGAAGTAGNLDVCIRGWGARGPLDDSLRACPVDCGDSGTLARLLMGVLAGYDGTFTLTGDASLCRRPMGRVAVPLQEGGVSFLGDAAAATLPLTFKGTARLAPFTYEQTVPSAQVKSALLLAAVRAEGRSIIDEPLPTRDHTERLLPFFGVPVETDGSCISIDGPRSLCAANISLPGDLSSAAPLAAACALLPASCVEFEDVGLNPRRLGFFTALRKMGVSVQCDPVTAVASASSDGLCDFVCTAGSSGPSCGIEPCVPTCGTEPRCSLSVAYAGPLHALEIPAGEVPSLIDELPLLALLAATAEGRSVFHGVGELRVKESDRLAGILEGLEALGYSAWAEGDDLHIAGAGGKSGGKPHPVPKRVALRSHGDHRMALTWLVAKRCLAPQVEIEDVQAIAISYPDFIQDIARLGAKG